MSDEQRADDNRAEEPRADERPPEQDAPIGGDESTEERLEADNPAEEDMLKTLDPDAPPA